MARRFQQIGKHTFWSEAIDRIKSSYALSARRDRNNSQGPIEFTDYMLSSECYYDAGPVKSAADASDGGDYYGAIMNGDV